MLYLIIFYQLFIILKKLLIYNNYNKMFINFNLFLI